MDYFPKVKLPSTLFLITALFVLILLLVWSSFVRRASSPTLGVQRELRPLRVGGVGLLVEVADTAFARYRGLSGREDLSERQGMLFAFPRPSRYPFCMRGMLVSLDFVWIRDGVVVEVLENVRPEDYPSLKSIVPKEPFDSVLEINAGVVERFGIKIGDEVGF